MHSEVHLMQNERFVNANLHYHRITFYTGNTIVEMNHSL